MTDVSAKTNPPRASNHAAEGAFLVNRAREWAEEGLYDLACEALRMGAKAWERHWLALMAEAPQANPGTAREHKKAQP